MQNVVKLIILGLTLISLCSCSKNDNKPSEIIKPVKFMLIDASIVKESRNFPGKVLATKEANLAFQVSGEVNSIKVSEGDNVNKDQLLASLDAKDFQDKLSQSKSKYEFDKLQFQRSKKLIKGNYISKSEYDEFQSKYEISKSNFNRAKRELSYTKLYAPFNGVIAKQEVQQHENVQAKQTIFLLQDISKIDIAIDIPEKLILSMKKGARYTTNASFVEHPQEFPLKFKEYSSQADPETRTYQVIFTMNRPKSINILPGMTANVHIILDKANTVSKGVYIPAVAVFAEVKGKPTVWLINEKTMTLSAIPIKVGHIEGANILVTEGLKSGMRIVVAGVHHLHQGQKVKLLKQQPRQ